MRRPPPDHGRLVGALLQSAAAGRQPAHGAFELTSRCNLACGMCYIRQAASDSTAESGELSAAEWVRLAGEAVDNGMVFLLLTGGEPLLRSDFFEIYEPIRTLGLHMTLFSNATLITREAARRLAKAPPNRLEVTLYGATEETYERVTSTPGGFSRCMAGIENLRAAGIMPTLKSTLNTYNIDELGAMRRMAREWGVPFTPAWLLTRRRDGAPSAVDRYRLAPAQVVRVEAAEYGELESESANRPGEQQAHTTGLDCAAGRNSFSITPSGEMNACLEMTLPAARPLECGFVKAWEQVRRYVDSVSRSAVCAACKWNPDCPRCPAISRTETGDATAPVPYFCEIQKEKQRRSTGA